MTIVPRGRGTLGYAQYLPKEVFLTTRAQITDQLSIPQFPYRLLACNATQVTIVPRGRGTLGYAQYLPKEVFLTTRAHITD